MNRSGELGSSKLARAQQIASSIESLK
uniref:Uncharacterized protein n=1 Tax=Arundo donax TaxID=35708 RepID=A0A0A8Z579_ARUDO